MCQTLQANSQQAPATQKPNNATPTASSINTGNWAGVLTANGDQYVSVYGSFTQSAASPYCGCGTSDTDEASWTGLGTGARGLLQQGTDMRGTPGTIFPWYEYLHPCGNPGCNPPEIRINNLPVNPGDVIGATTSYDPASGRTTFQVCASQCATIVAYLDGSYYDGRFADYIDERPDWCAPNHCYKPLTNFSYNDWTGYGYTTTGVWNGLNAVPGYSVFMVNSSGQELAGPVAWYSNATFRDVWIKAS